MIVHNFSTTTAMKKHTILPSLVLALACCVPRMNDAENHSATPLE